MKDVFDLVEQFIEECIDSYNKEVKTPRVEVFTRTVNDEHSIAMLSLSVWENVMYFYRHLAYYTTQHDFVYVLHSGVKSGTFRVVIYTDEKSLNVWG